MEDNKTPMVSAFMTESVMTRMERIRVRLEISLAVAVAGLGVTNIIWLLVFHH